MQHQPDHEQDCADNQRDSFGIGMVRVFMLVMMLLRMVMAVFVMMFVLMVVMVFVLMFMLMAAVTMVMIVMMLVFMLVMRVVVRAVGFLTEYSAFLHAVGGLLDAGEQILGIRCRDPKLHGCIGKACRLDAVELCNGGFDPGCTIGTVKIFHCINLLRWFHRDHSLHKFEHLNDCSNVLYHI